MSESAVAFIRNLFSAAANVPLYGAAHPHVHQLLDVAELSLRDALKERSEIAFDVIGDEIVIDCQPQPFNVYLSRCAALLSSRGLSRLRVRRGVSQQELMTLVTGLTLPVAEGGRLLSSQNIKVGCVAAGLAEGGAQDAAEVDPLPAAHSALQSLARQDADLAKEMRETVRSQRKLDMAAVSSMTSAYIKALQLGGNAFIGTALADEATLSFAGNVAVLTMALAMAIGIKGTLLHDIGVAGMLHNVGTLLVPEEVREHPIRGAKFLLNSPGVPRLAVLAAFEHHINYALSGYPCVPPQWRINSCSHMITICDFFVTRRMNAAGTEPATILRSMMRVAGKELHPTFTPAFCSRILQSAHL